MSWAPALCYNGIILQEILGDKHDNDGNLVKYGQDVRRIIFHPTTVILDDKQREQLQGYDPGFPYTAMDCQFDRYLGPCVDWHWHATMEINVGVEGTLETTTQRGAYLVRPGEAVFINANVLHRNEAYQGSRAVRMRTHMFDRGMLGGGQLPQRRYVAPVAECAGLDALKLTRADPVQREMLDKLDRIFQAAQAEAPGYELEICGLLNQVWRGIYALAKPRLGQGGGAARPETQRLKVMLAFIRDHYAEDIGIQDIAQAAGICQRECHRCFKQELGTTPLATLTDYRLGQAAALLRDSPMTVTQIAGECGFTSASYFGKVFRQRMNLAPQAYRRGAAPRAEK